MVFHLVGKNTANEKKIVTNLKKTYTIENTPKLRKELKQRRKSGNAQKNITHYTSHDTNLKVAQLKRNEAGSDCEQEREDWRRRDDISGFCVKMKRQIFEEDERWMFPVQGFVYGVTPSRTSASSRSKICAKFGRCFGFGSQQSWWSEGKERVRENKYEWQKQRRKTDRSEKKKRQTTRGKVFSSAFNQHCSSSWWSFRISFSNAESLLYLRFSQVVADANFLFSWNFPIPALFLTLINCCW